MFFILMNIIRIFNKQNYQTGDENTKINFSKIMTMSITQFFYFKHFINDKPVACVRIST